MRNPEAGPFDVPALRAALRAVPVADWSLPSSFAATRVHHGYRRAVLTVVGPFGFVLERFHPVRDAWVSWIEPGGFIVPHKDKGPHMERWQIPVVAGDFDGVDAVAGVPFRVEQWKTHSVWNLRAAPRVHVVIDRDITANPDSSPFVALPVPPEHEEHVYGRS